MTSSFRSELLSSRYLILITCLALTLLGSSLADSRKPDNLAAPLASIDHEILGWQTMDQQQLTPQVLEKLRPSSYISRIYQKGGRQLALFIAYYAQQRAGESMHSPKACLPGSGWEIARQGSAILTVAGEPIRVNQYHIQNAGEHALAFYWYQSRHRIVANEYLGKLLLIQDSLIKGYTSGSIVRITVPDDSWSSREAISFAQALIPQVRHCFGD